MQPAEEEHAAKEAIKLGQALRAEVASLKSGLEESRIAARERSQMADEENKALELRQQARRRAQGLGGEL